MQNIDLPKGKEKQHSDLGKFTTSTSTSATTTTATTSAAVCATTTTAAAEAAADVIATGSATTETAASTSIGSLRIIETANESAPVQLALDIQSDPELRSGGEKSKKARSRFTTALRKLSKSRKREKVSATKETEAALTSGGEDLPEETATTSAASSSADATALNENKTKKKSKLSKRLLGSLRRSKSEKSKGSTDRTDEEAEQITKSLDDERQQQDQQQEQQQQQQQQQQLTATTEKPISKVSKVQITISGKKVETKRPLDAGGHKGVRNTDLDAAAATVTATPPTAIATETDYLTPIGQTITTATTATGAVGVVDVKAKAKSNITTITTTLKTPTKTTEQPSESAKTSSSPRITQSTRDTPPRERAPARPANPPTPPSCASPSPSVSASASASPKVSAITSASCTSSIASRAALSSSSSCTASSKFAHSPTTTGVSATHNQPASITTAVTAAPATTTTTTAAITPIIAPTGTTTRGSRWSVLRRRQLEQELKQKIQQQQQLQEHLVKIEPASTGGDLMQQQPIGTPQRGHRFPNPTTVSGNAIYTSANNTTTTPAPTATTSTANEVNGLNVTQELPTTEGGGGGEKQQSPRPPTNATKDQLLLQLLQPPTLTPPPPTPPTPHSDSATQEIRSATTTTTTTVRHPSTSTDVTSISPIATSQSTSATSIAEAALQLLQHNQLHIDIDESVVNASSSGADDAISSAESAQPSEDYNTNIDNHHQQQQQQQAFLQDITSIKATQRFVLAEDGASAESTSLETLLERRSIDQDSPKSSDSISQASDRSLRRIRYVEQPTLYDEFSKLNLRDGREALRYHQYGLNQTSFESADYEDDEELNQLLQQYQPAPRKERQQEKRGKLTKDQAKQQMPAFGDLTMDEEMEPTITTAANTEKREHLYKILVIGELGTGKTSFIKRYVHQFFSQNYRATIGVDFALKVLHWDANTIVRLQLWDIAGQERFGNMTRVYYKEAVGAFIVFDVTRSGTFDCVSKWKEDLDSKVQLPDGSPIPCILLANKSDQEKQGLVTTPEKMDEYVRENGFAGWFETSAKENVNIDEAARALVSKILLNDKLISTADLADSEKFNLNNSDDEKITETKNKCSC